MTSRRKFSPPRYVPSAIGCSSPRSSRHDHTVDEEGQRTTGSGLARMNTSTGTGSSTRRARPNGFPVGVIRCRSSMMSSARTVGTCGRTSLNTSRCGQRREQQPVRREVHLELDLHVSPLADNSAIRANMSSQSCSCEHVSQVAQPTAPPRSQAFCRLIHRSEPINGADASSCARSRLERWVAK